MTVRSQKMIKDLKFHIFILQTCNQNVAITNAHLISAILYHSTGQQQVILRHNLYHMSVVHCNVL